MVTVVNYRTIISINFIYVKGKPSNMSWYRRKFYFYNSSNILYLIREGERETGLKKKEKEKLIVRVEMINQTDWKRYELTDYNKK